MALSTRELYLALRVRDEGTRNLQRFAAELTRTGTAARIASLRAQADAIREQAALKRNEAAIQRVHVAQLRANQASQAQIRGAQAKVSVLQKESVELEKQAKDLDRQATAIQRSTDKLNHFTGTLTQTGIALQTLGVGIGFLGVTGFAVMNQLVDVAIEYQRQVALTTTQIDNFQGTAAQIGDIGRRVAKDIAVPFESIQPALFDIFSSMEVTVEEAEFLLRAFARGAVAGQTDIQAASRATIGIMNAFAIPVSEVNRLLDLQFQLVQEGIGSYEEWTARIGQVSPSAVRANQSLEIMLAALATTTRFGIPAAMSATAVARAFDALSNPTAVERLEELGVKARNADGTLRPFNEIMRQFRDVLMDMPAEDRVETILDVFRGAGSTIQARKFLQSILLGEQGLETFDLILSEMTGDTGAFENAYATMADTVAMKSEIISNKWMLIKESIGATLLPAFEEFLGMLERFLDWFDRLPAATKHTIGQIILWGSALAVVFGIIFIGIGLLSVFISSLIATWSVMAPLVVVGAGLIAVFGLMAAMFGTLWTKSDPFRRLMRDLWEDLKELGGIVVDTFRAIGDAFNEHLRPSLERLWTLFNDKVIPAFQRFRSEIWEELKPKLQEAGRLIGDVFGKVFQALGWLINNWVIPAIEELGRWWERNKEKMEPVIAAAAQLAKWLLVIVAICVGILIVVIGGTLAAAFVALAYAFMFVVEAINEIDKKARLMWATIQWLWSQITGLFEDADERLIDAGKNFIRGFIHGMTTEFGRAVELIKQFGLALLNGLSTVLAIKSPSKKMMYLGRESALGYAIGFQQTLASAMMGTNDFLGLGVPEFAPQQQRPVGGADEQGRSLMPASEKKSVTNNITIYTQEFDAREQSAKLGWELAGRM